MMGQLGLPSQPEIALPLIHHAARLTFVLAPEPACEYLTLTPLGEFSLLSRNSFITLFISPHSSAQQAVHLPHFPPFRACSAEVRTCVRVRMQTPTLSVRERPILLARQSTRGSRRGSKDIDAARVWNQLVSRVGEMREWLIPTPRRYRLPIM